MKISLIKHLHTGFGLLTFLILLTVRAGAATFYVNVSNTAPVAPFTNWPTAATDIQSAIDVATDGDLILVTNGVYQNGGRPLSGYALTNRLLIDKAITVESVNGAGVTIIQGYELPGVTNGDCAVRCVYLTNNATLIGFTLTGGATRTNGVFQRDGCGGAIWCEDTNSSVARDCIMSNNAATAAIHGSFSNCTFVANSGGGASSGSALFNCLLSGNFAYSGGGAGGGVSLNNCVLQGNSATLAGGGAATCFLTNCTLTGNTVAYGGWGGAAYACTLYGCLISSNLALGEFGYGGGLYQSTAVNCTLSDNWAGQYGGGSYYGTLINCVLTRNTAAYGTGGGAYYGTLNNCTVTGNWARDAGGGSYFSTLNNSIVYYNISRQYPNYYRSNLVSYCCTTPNPGGLGNIGSEPLLASDSHLSFGSPCRGAGNRGYASGLDIDGEAWLNPPSIGADELRTNGDTGPLTVAIQATWTNGVSSYTMPFTGVIHGPARSSCWSFGDGITISNHPYVTHIWQAPGIFPVVLTAFNASYPGGISSTAIVQVAASFDLYVSASSTNSVIPYQSWATAATNIQDAVDMAAQFAGATVWVADGVYTGGGRITFETLSNRVAVSTPITVRSVNGPSVTTIRGYQVPGTTNDYGAVRCVYLTNGVSLIGFTLTGGAAYGNDTVYEQSGGGVWGEDTSVVVSNCILVGNSALHGGGARGVTLVNCVLSNNMAFGSGVVGFGGGAAYCTLNGCVLTENSAGGGGATEQCVLNNCQLSSNSATFTAEGGGAAYYGTLNYCILRGNSSISAGGAAYMAVLNNCALFDNSSPYGGASYSGTLTNCTVVNNSSPDYGGGVYRGTAWNCIIYNNTAPSGPNCYSANLGFCCSTPVFAGTGNITNNPAFVDLGARNLRLSSNSPCINSGKLGVGFLDLDGNPRISGGTVDMGAYEFQTPTSVISYAWLQLYGLPTDGSADYLDSDNTGMNNWQKWIAGLNPTDPTSVLAMTSSAVGTNFIGVKVTWQSVNTRTYYLQRATDLLSPSGFSSIQSNLAGKIGTTSYTDSTATNGGPYFYRVGVQ